jgi:hypothetical protein
MGGGAKVSQYVHGGNSPGEYGGGGGLAHNKLPQAFDVNSIIEQLAKLLDIREGESLKKGYSRLPYTHITPTTRLQSSRASFHQGVNAPEALRFPASGSIPQRPDQQKIYKEKTRLNNF